MKLGRSFGETKPDISPSEVLKLLSAYDAWGIPYLQQIQWFRQLGLHEQYAHALYMYEARRNQNKVLTKYREFIRDNIKPIIAIRR